MNENFEKFNKLFPNSSYRVIKDGTKIPINSSIHKYEDISDSSSRVGWIISDGYIVVDVDDATNAIKLETLLNSEKIPCCEFHTEHGAHFIFRYKKDDIRNTARCSTLLSIYVDYRVAGKGYIVLPFNDDKREWTKLTENIAELPYFLKPIKYIPNADMSGLKEGDGRNSAIFSWFGKIKLDGNYTKDEKINVIKLINDYIFEEPMDDGELLKTILRDQNTSSIEEKSSDKKSIAQREAEIAEQIRNEHTFRVFNKNLYVYTGSSYRFIDDRELEVMIARDYAPLFREPNRKEVISKIKLLSPQIEDDSKYWSYVSFDNCILDILTGKVYDPSEDFFIMTHIDRNYVAEAQPTERVDKFLNHCSGNDPQKRQLILEMFGDCLLKKAMFQKMYIIYGEGGTGKSTLLRIIKDFVGSRNCSFLSTKDLENTFMPAEMMGKLVNIGDDIPITRISDTSQIKKLVSGEPMQIQRKFQEPIWFANYATMIFTANKLPNSSDRTSGWMRRLTLIDLNVRVTEASAFFAESLSEEDYDYLTNIAVNAIRDAVKRGELTKSFAVDQNLEAYKRMQSTLYEFVDDNEITKDYLVGLSVQALYEEYLHYCYENGMKSIGKHTVMQEMCALFYLTVRKEKDDEGNLAMRFCYVTNKK